MAQGCSSVSTEKMTNNVDKKISSKQVKIHKYLQALLDKADIQINGERAWDPQIHNPDTYNRLLADGSIGAGESYMEGWWDCAQLDELISRIMTIRFDRSLNRHWKLIGHTLLAKLTNMQTQRRAWQVGEQHYDAGNDLYASMLGETMAYTCGYWENADNLDDAQRAKLDLICQKLKLKKGEHVLDIGCGWGSFCQYAAANYDVNIAGVTISKEQQKYAQSIAQELPVDIKLKDYRDMHGQFDKLTSIGMFEHVGPKNYDIYMQTAHRLMKDDSIFVLHTIGSDVRQFATDPWVHKYIFPNGVIPSLAQISEACEPYFVIEDVHNFGQDYDTTLMAWARNVDNAWESLKNSYNERFYRMWQFYLKSSAGSFRSRHLQLYQLVLRKKLKPMSRYSCR